MEQPNTIFSLSIDPVTKSHLIEAAKWARFLAIVGMISLVLLVVIGFYFSIMMTGTLKDRFDETGNGQAISLGIGIGVAIMYLVMAVIWFFPLMYLLRFSNQMRTAIEGNDQESLNTSVQNLKICFRYLGIVTIIGILFYILFFAISFATQNQL
ncbi:MAG TPA: hypothetical protein VGC29_07350 [Flavisolibacter sp.]